MIVTKDELLKSRKTIQTLLKGKIFIYPTDSIYGLGCDATNEKLVQKIRTIKKSNLQPFSIIVPSKEWVYKNCEVGPEQKKYVEKLGKKLVVNGEEHCFTLVLKLKNKSAVAKNVNQGLETIGVRIPDHWFSGVVSNLGVPVITTSANSTGEDFMTSIDDLSPSIKRQVDLIVYEGEKKGHLSIIIHAERKTKEMKIR